MLYTFVITTPNGAVLDFGTYPVRECTEDTANDSPAWVKGNTVTIVEHDEDGQHVILSADTIEEE